ncbi:hypothetical protein RvY_10454 [Ramazzottius varieornatus]|uniref:Uncharacterized protein n=1 Tax=Ramazzottius varieornatus TaxID=947166 RepID=A0A1D1VEW3_RAMVA|nr:hypothetical protein RvY_10454 [Ramazzottius varieornatus]
MNYQIDESAMEQDAERKLNALDVRQSRRGGPNRYTTLLIQRDIGLRQVSKSIREIVSKIWRYN